MNLDEVNSNINAIEYKINRMKFTMYNGYNYDESFVNYKLIAKLNKELKTLKLKQWELIYEAK